MERRQRVRPDDGLPRRGRARPSARDRRRRRTFFANAGDDVHAVGSLAPLIPGHIGCVVIRPDGSRVLARAVRDPLVHQRPE